MNAEVDITGVIIKTERLVLRPFELSDLDDFYEYASVDGVGQMAGWLPHKNKEESLVILNKFIDHKKTFAITYNGKVIGSLGIEKYNEEKFPEFSDKKAREIGYILSKDYWGQGLMPEAVKAVIDYCFNTLDYDMLFCAHFVENYRSQRVQEKCGFKHYKMGKFETRYGVIKDDWVSILMNNRH
ncbi:MAG: GNAT family N-acetyltransferase [Bacilli bacterium]|nr:GNAT family N-acetyltransferase [Bacilli bacterium]